ncbi:PHT1-8, partial [Symbiodinium necroappetens]
MELHKQSLLSMERDDKARTSSSEQPAVLLRLYLTMVLSIAGALVSAFAVPLSPNNPTSVFVFLSVARFVLGAGVGGVYPLAATVAAEGSDASTRGRSVALVFSMQGIGQLLVPIVSMAIVYNIGTYDDRVASHKPLP